MNLKEALILDEEKAHELICLIEYHCLRVQEIEVTGRHITPAERDNLRTLCETALMEITEKYEEIIEGAEDQQEYRREQSEMAAEYLIESGLDDDDQEQY